MKLKKVISFFSSILLCVSVSTTSVFLTSCSKHKDFLEEFMDADHTWEDVEYKKNSMISGIERNSGIEWRSSKKLQAKYLKEEDYTKERAETYQSNLELELDKFKEEPNASANDAFDLLNEEEEKENLTTFDWALVNKHIDGLRNEIHDKISSIDGLTDKDRASLYDSASKKFNEILFNAKNQKSDFQGTMDYVNLEVEKYIKEELPSASNKMIAQNSLYSFVTSQDFSINQQLLDGDGSFSFRSWEKSTSDEEKRTIEDKMLSNLFTFEKLPVNKGTVSDKYSFSFKISNLEWNNLTTAKINIVFILSDVESQEQLASFEFPDIEVTDNKQGFAIALEQYIEKISLDKNEDAPGYRSFKSEVENSAIKIGDKKFITNDLLSSVVSLNLDSLSQKEKEDIAQVSSKNLISFGAFCDFKDDDQKTSGTVNFNLCIYDPLALSSPDQQENPVFIQQKNIISFPLSVDLNDDAKDVLFNENSVVSATESVSSALSSYEYYASKENLDDVEKNAKQTTSIHDVAISYTFFATLTNVASFVVDALVGTTFIVLDIASFAIDIYEILDTVPWTKTAKETAAEQKKEFLEARNSDEFKKIQKAVNEGNLRQTQREIENKAKEFLTKSQDTPNCYGITVPEELIKNFEEKYGLNRENAVKKIDSTQRDIINFALVTAGSTIQTLGQALKLILWEKATTFFQKSIKIMDFNAYSMAILPGFARDRISTFITPGNMQDVAFCARNDIFINELKLFDMDVGYEMIAKDYKILQQGVKEGKEYLRPAVGKLFLEYQGILDFDGSVANAKKSLVGLGRLESVSMPTEAFGSNNFLLSAIESNRYAIEEGKHFLDNPQFVGQMHDILINEGLVDTYTSRFGIDILDHGFKSPIEAAKEYMPNSYKYFTEQIDKVMNINYTSKLPSIQKQLIDTDLSIWSTALHHDTVLKRDLYKCTTQTGQDMVRNALSKTRADKYIADNFKNADLASPAWTVADSTKASKDFIDYGFEEAIEATSSRVKYYGYSGGSSGQTLTKYGFCKKVSEKNSHWLKRNVANSDMQEQIYKVLSSDITTDQKDRMLLEINENADMIYKDKAKWSTAVDVQSDATSLTTNIEKLERYSFWVIIGLSIVTSVLREIIYEFKTRMQIIE